MRIRFVSRLPDDVATRTPVTMTCSVDEAVASLYPLVNFSHAPCNLSDFATEEDDAWLASVRNQKAQLEVSPITLAAPVPDVEDFDFAIGVVDQIYSQHQTNVEVPDIHMNMHACTDFYLCNTTPSPKPTENRHQSPTNVDPTSGIVRRSSSASKHNKSPFRTRNVRPWASDEHERFVAALERFRTDETEKVFDNGFHSTGLGPGIADVIATVVGTRDAAQVRSHAQKHFQRLRREAAKKATEDV